MRLSPFSFVILVLVGRGGAGPHDLRRMAEDGRVYWDAAPSQWYAEPKRLEAHGYLAAHKTPGRTRERTHYTLTERGREALAEWVRTPAPRPGPRGAGGGGPHPRAPAADPERAGDPPRRRRPRRPRRGARGAGGDAPRPRGGDGRRRGGAGTGRGAHPPCAPPGGQPPLRAKAARSPSGMAGGGGSGAYGRKLALVAAAVLKR